MLANLLITLGSSALALAAPTASSQMAKRDSQLSCVQFMYGGPFTSFGANGYVHIYANVTQFHSDSQTTTFDETRLGINANGELADCGDCRSTQQFGFEVCQGPDRKGYNGLENSPEFFYGHILFTNDQASIQCLQAERTPVNGSLIKTATCEYDYDSAGASDQYFQMSVSDDGVYYARLQPDSVGTYGVLVGDDGEVTLYDGPATGPFSYLGFKID